VVSAFSQLDFPSSGERFGTHRRKVLVFAEHSIMTGCDQQKRRAALFPGLFPYLTQIMFQRFKVFLVADLLHLARLAAGHLRKQLGDLVRVDTELPQVKPRLPSVISFSLIHDARRRF
jgi:hypothetical protein